MAGFGSRFRAAGYSVPKYQIEVHGKTLFEWSMDSLKDFFSDENRYIFLVRREDHAEGFIRDACTRLGLESLSVVELDAPTDGQATTALAAGSVWLEPSPLLIYNIDTYVEPYAMKAIDVRGDGFIPCFCAPGEHWSFVLLGEDGKAVEVREKKRISDYCTLGAYYFKSCTLYRALYEEYYSDGHLEAKERYIAPLYNLLVQKGGDVQISVIANELVHVLGTPEELESFRTNPLFSSDV